MSADAWLTLAVIAVLFGLLIWDRWPTWAVVAGTVAAIITRDLAKFINPAGYQTHLMVMGPAEYTFADFVKVGVPLTVLLGIVVVPLAVLLYAA